MQGRDSFNAIYSGFSRPYVKSQKKDVRDVEAIAEAAQWPTMCFVRVRTQAQLDLQTTYPVRKHLVEQTVCHYRGSPVFQIGSRLYIPVARSEGLKLSVVDGDSAPLARVEGEGSVARHGLGNKK